MPFPWRPALALGPVLLAGCAALTPEVMPLTVVSAGRPPSTSDPLLGAEVVRPASYRASSAPSESQAPGPAPPGAAQPLTPQPVPPACPFAGLGELSADELVREVLARNPSLAQMAAAAQAAAARYPQVTSLDDPMFGVTTAPGAWGSNQVEGGYRLDVSQKFPWPGKLPLRGANAAAEASAAGRQVDDTRLQLTEAARMAFYDYYLAARAAEVNEEGLRLLREFRQNAETRYQTGLAAQQDVLQADVEIGRQRERLLTVERMRQVAVARINTLLHLPPDGPLPPPPPRLRPEGPLPGAPELRALAQAGRPDLRALADRLAAEQASLQLARTEFYPDVEVMAGYDAFWQERPLRTMVGARLNLPVRKARRTAAVTEAQARVAERQAELARLCDQVSFEVQQAYAQVRESEQTLRLYQETILPAAEANIKAAQSAYVTAKVPFVSLIDAQRNLVGLRDRYHEAVADYFRRRAALERAVGAPIVPSPPIPAQCATPP